MDKTQFCKKYQFSSSFFFFNAHNLLTLFNSLSILLFPFPSLLSSLSNYSKKQEEKQLKFSKYDLK